MRKLPISAGDSPNLACSQHKRSFKGQVTRAGTEFFGGKNQATTTCPGAAFEGPFVETAWRFRPS
jgi:hypothetical protein